MTCHPTVIVMGSELVRLRKLPWLPRIVFIELLAIFHARIITSDAVRQAILEAPPAPSHIGAALSTLLVENVLQALQQLHDARLVHLDCPELLEPLARLVATATMTGPGEARIR